MMALKDRILSIKAIEAMYSDEVKEILARLSDKDLSSMINLFVGLCLAQDKKSLRQV